MRKPSFALVCLGLFAFSTSAQAGFYDYEALVDVDNNPATGGDVTIVQGNEAPHVEHGIDYRISVLSDTCPGGMVDNAQVAKWNGANFIITTVGAVSYPAVNGAGQGIGGSQLIEWQVPASGVPEGLAQAKIIFHASETQLQANDYTTPFYLSVVSVPTLSTWALLGLALVLGLASLALLRRRQSGKLAALAFVCMAAAASAVWAASFTMDGSSADWAGIAPKVSDPAGDSSIHDDNEDIFYGFVDNSGSNLVFRVDVGSAPTVCG